ncbi:hypothetical protein FQA47_004996 [Oryzias melastigma]|uniref:Uncharacterized protein n=1 Tax=Oryzias melastigma TaxID=30732 RepID=A0A834FSJ5_ORYME|nr:hypothetical protein FQA47_004996 [Oryzias melastigma]
MRICVSAKFPLTSRDVICVPPSPLSPHSSLCLSLHSLGPLPRRPDLHLRANARPHRPRRLRTQQGERVSGDTTPKDGKAGTAVGRKSTAASH